MTTATADKKYTELKTLAEVQEWASSRFQTPEQMWPVEKRPSWRWTGYTINALAPIYGDYSIEIEKAGCKWIVFTEDGHGDFADFYKTKKEAVAAAREFAEFFYNCYIDNTDGQED